MSVPRYFENWVSIIFLGVKGVSDPNLGALNWVHHNVVAPSFLDPIVVDPNIRMIICYISVLQFKVN